MRQDAAYGMIPVFSPPEGPWRYLLILHNKGHWGFPKGHADLGETELETAQRELEEETGLNHYRVVETARFTEHYQFVNPKGIETHKTVVYFLAWIESPQEPQVTIQVTELADYRWCPYEAGMQLITFEASQGVLRECEAYLKSQSDPR